MKVVLTKEIHLIPVLPKADNPEYVVRFCGFLRGENWGATAAHLGLQIDGRNFTFTQYHHFLSDLSSVPALFRSVISPSSLIPMGAIHDMLYSWRMPGYWKEWRTDRRPDGGWSVRRMEQSEMRQILTREVCDKIYLRLMLDKCSKSAGRVAIRLAYRAVRLFGGRAFRNRKVFDRRMQILKGMQKEGPFSRSDHEAELGMQADWRTRMETKRALGITDA